MFSLEKLYHVLYKNLLEPANLLGAYFQPFGSVSPNDIQVPGYTMGIQKRKPTVLFYDQEPLFIHNIEVIKNHKNKELFLIDYKHQPTILANSEYSAEKTQISEENNFNDWYYFFHGFAALNWYRDYQYIPNVENHFSKVFISYNRLITKYRSYRLNLVSEFIEQDILKNGHVSLRLVDELGSWESELTDPHSYLSNNAKTKIQKHISCLTGPLILDHINPPGWFSADVNWDLERSALWHVVSETIFYHKKLHLTEKTFKPIVTYRPFILVSSPGQLAYLKSYGFKTFDKWIDESYDEETDDDLRIEKITRELKKFSGMTPDQLKDIYEEMLPVIEYNYYHFYNDFKKHIVNEMVENFKTVIDNAKIATSKIDYPDIIKRLSQ